MGSRRCGSSSVGSIWVSSDAARQAPAFFMRISGAVRHSVMLRCCCCTIRSGHDEFQYLAPNIFEGELVDSPYQHQGKHDIESLCGRNYHGMSDSVKTKRRCSDVSCRIFELHV